MSGNLKRNTLIVLGLVMIMTMIIAASLPALELQPGMPLPGFENSQPAPTPVPVETVGAIQINEFVKVLMILILVVTWLIMTFKILREAGLRNIAAVIKPVLLTSLVIGVLIFLVIALLPKSKTANPAELPMPDAMPLLTSPLGPVPLGLLWLVGFLLLAASVLLGVWIFTPPTSQPSTLEILGLEAEKARQALRTGLGLREVIVTCYRQMSLALEQEQGLERKESMTTREFEKYLEAAGIARVPVHQLTLLFEAVRYGNWQPNPLDEQNAIQSLEAIIASSQAVKKGAD